MSPAEIRDEAIKARRDELLTVKEFALLVRQHEKTIRRRIQDGRQPGALQVGGEWRIDVVAATVSTDALAPREPESRDLS